MFLSSLRLRNFRNLAEQRLEFPPEGVALIGDNGQGKTNLLEAIYYLAIFRSFRGAADDQLVRFGDDVFHIEGHFGTIDGPRQVTAAFDKRARRKKVTVGGAEIPRLADAIGTAGVVVFSPADVEIIAGSPGVRRRFLDIVLSLTEPGYLRALQRYRQVLAQRNALLRQGAAAPLVDAWNEGLVRWGSRVMAARARWTCLRAASFASHVRAISEYTAAALIYEPSVPRGEGFEDQDEALDVERIAESFETELVRTRDREARRGMTLVGPHRDDLRVRARTGEAQAWLDLRVYGSGGQQRTAAVALRMVEAENLKESTGRTPVVLLDDVFAELDPGRSRRILDWVENHQGGQVILTAPKPSDIELRGASLPRWTIRDGVVSAL